MVKKKLNVSYKKTRLIPGKAPSEEVQKKFIKKILRCMRRAEKGEEYIIFSDPMHQVHNSENSYAWQFRGKEGTRYVLANSGRKRLNIIGALNPIILKPEIILTEDSCDGSFIEALLFEIRKSYPDDKLIRIFLDNASYQHTEEVKETAKRLNIKLEYLPPYSPNLNLIERLWKFFKKKIIKNKYYETFAKFKKAISDFFKNFDDYIEELRSIITDKFEIIKSG